MTKSYLKVVLMGVVALLLCYFNKAYSLYIMLLFIFVCAINAYQLESHYQRMGRFFQREKDNEIKEVEIENKYHEKILSQLIRSMNLPMLFIDKEGKIAFTNQSFRKGFEIPHLKGRYYKDIFVGEMLDLVDQCYVFERPLSSVVKIQSRYYQVESSPVFSDKEHLIFDGTIVLFTDVSKMKEIEDMQKQFLSDVSHELKTPMSAIIGSVEILKRDGLDSPEIFQEFMDILLKESYRMQNIINDILELSRLDQTRVKLDFKEIDIKKDDNKAIVTVGAGVSLGLLAQKLLKESIGGFEFASGIPGTIGGAVRMNAGAYGGEFKDIVISTKCIDITGNIIELANKEQDFSYRHSAFMNNNLIIIQSKLMLDIQENQDEIKQKMDENLNSRKSKQPINMPNAGSTFKRGSDFITAKLIDECGLKGYTIGGAQISDVHAGFVVNIGNATAEDVLSLVDYVKNKVYEKFKKEIQLEVEVIGE